MWDDVLNNPNQCKVLREFMGDIMNKGIYYDVNIQRENTSDRIIWSSNIGFSGHN